MQMSFEWTWRALVDFFSVGLNSHDLPGESIIYFLYLHLSVHQTENSACTMFPRDLEPHAHRQRLKLWPGFFQRPVKSQGDFGKGLKGKNRVLITLWISFCLVSQQECTYEKATRNQRLIVITVHLYVLELGFNNEGCLLQSQEPKVQDGGKSCGFKNPEEIGKCSLLCLVKLCPPLFSIVGFFSLSIRSLETEDFHLVVSWSRHSNRCFPGDT